MMSKSVFVAGLVAVVAGSKFEELKAQQDFTKFIQKYDKQYPTEEVFSRFAIFQKNTKMIQDHDSDKEGWSMAVNEFADMEWEEFAQMYKGYKHRKGDYKRSLNEHQITGKDLADSVDWRTKDAVTPVKDQGQCGSCWAFSTTGGVEGAVAIGSGKLPNLAEQQLVDCAGSAGNQGCNGGLMDNAFEWIIDNGGIAAEADYRYTASDGTCKKGLDAAATIKGYKDVKSGDEDALMDAINQQPVSIAIEADQSGFQFYSGGVFTGTCGKNLDHGVLLAGYGTENGDDYWLVKNSWGSSWGDSGYIKLVRGKDQCGLADAASYPTV